MQWRVGRKERKKRRRGAGHILNVIFRENKMIFRKRRRGRIVNRAVGV
jgi:hypothetical protein